MMNKEELTENLVNYVASILRPYKAIRKADGLVSFRHLDNAEDRCYGAVDFFLDILNSNEELTEEDEEEIDNYWTFIQSEFKALRGE